jgi:hypothetical protein
MSEREDGYMAKIKDFGEKIGGARKDTWRARGLQVEDLVDMNEMEKIKYVTRDNVWPLPDAKKLVEDGLSSFIAFWQREVRKKIFKLPAIPKSTANGNEIIEIYIRIASEIRDKAMACKSMDDIQDFYGYVAEHISSYSHCTDWKYCVSNDMVYLQYYHGKMKRTIQKKGFPFSTKQPADTKARKKSFIPPQLTHIEREGEDYRHGANIFEDKWQKEFSFRGIEFGNWMSQKDRQASMNYCYDALRDLSKALMLDDTDIAFGGDLALAFGARGNSRASAHYEPLREVINLTKMHGAGCTAHEWMHALDDKLGKWTGILNPKGNVLASESQEINKLPKSFVTLVKALKQDANGNKTDYFIGSKKFGKQYSKESHGYWESNCEMLARAFACYVKDTLDCKSDYLIAHADSYLFEFDNERACAIPQGEERELFNELFDQLFYELKQIGFFHEPKPKPTFKTLLFADVSNQKSINSVETTLEPDGQFTFCL